jgi:hypothetical protein
MSQKVCCMLAATVAANSAPGAPAGMQAMTMLWSLMLPRK